MPYRIVKRSGARPYKIVKRSTGEVVGTSVSKKKALVSIYKREQGAKELSK